MTKEEILNKLNIWLKPKIENHFKYNERKGENIIIDELLDYFSEYDLEEWLEND